VPIDRHYRRLVAERVVPLGVEWEPNVRRGTHRHVRSAPWPVVLCLVAVVSCSGDPSNDGPLGQPSDSGSICVPVDKDGVVTDGFMALRNRGSKPVTLHSVKLVNPHGLQLQGSYVAPIRNHNLIGLRPGVWSGTRLPLADAIVPAHSDLNLLTQLRLDNKDVAGATGGLEVRYTAGSKDYRWVSRFRVQLPPVGRHCEGGG
jgi:hypothetical protein